MSSYTIAGAADSDTQASFSGGGVTTGALNTSAGPVGSASDPIGTTAHADVAAIAIGTPPTGLSADLVDIDCIALPGFAAAAMEVTNLEVLDLGPFSGPVNANTAVPTLPPGVFLTLNEQIVTPPQGRITANAIHLTFVGQTDTVIGSVTCTATGSLGIQVSSLSARRSGSSVVLRWRAEAGALGFNVYRQAGRARVKANRTLIPARFGTAGSYRFVDRSRATRGSVRYWLQAVESDGSRSWHGPVALG